ncbi:MAG: DUF2199 domain-containing protein [Pseudomonadota bacterium]
MRIEDLQPLDKVFICTHVFDNPDWLLNVDHRDAGELDFMCNHDHGTEDMTWLCAAHLPVLFPQLRTLGEVPIGQTAAFDGVAWALSTLPYDDGDSPGPMPAPPDRDLGEWVYTCACCGEQKRGLPELAFNGPVQARDAEGDPDYDILEHTADLCRIRIEGEEFFWIRGLLPVAIPEARDTYCFGAWSSISATNFARYRETFDQDQRDLGQMFGYFANVMPEVPGTLSLQLSIVPAAPGQRPLLLLREPDEPHPLFDAQQQGITVETLMDWIGPSLACSGSG